MKITIPFAATMVLLASTLPNVRAEEKPFVKKGMEQVRENDGFIELKVSEAKKKKALAALEKLAKELPAVENEEDGWLSIKLKVAAAVAENFVGGTSSIGIEGSGGESPDTYTFTFTDLGWLDDALEGQRYQYVIRRTVKEGKPVLALVSAKAWMKPWPERYKSHLEYVKSQSVEW